MQILVNLYNKTIIWAQHKHAPRYLAAVSFIEASVFPISPVFMLTPMAIAHPRKAFKYALIATVFSVLGGFLGYFLGYVLFDPLVMPLLKFFGQVDNYQKVTTLFQERGFWAILIAGFTPIPYKFVAIGAGFMRVPLMPFFLGSLLGRAIKFFAIALVVRVGGERIEQNIRKVIERSGLTLLGMTLGLIGLKLFRVI
jgi:membrane protein YqaA with SNARE-associated domain